MVNINLIKPWFFLFFKKNNNPVPRIMINFKYFVKCFFLSKELFNYKIDWVFFGWINIKKPFQENLFYSKFYKKNNNKIQRRIEYTINKL